jgi:hypothetical protein
VNDEQSELDDEYVLGLLADDFTVVARFALSLVDTAELAEP